MDCQKMKDLRNCIKFLTLLIKPLRTLPKQNLLGHLPINVKD